MLTLYRRHVSDCKHKNKINKCSCPVWVKGHLKERSVRKAMKTRNWGAAEREIERWLESPEKQHQRELQALPFQTASQKFLAQKQLKNLAESTITSYRRTLDNLRAYLETRNLTAIGAISLDDLDGFQQSRAFVTSNTRRKEAEHLRAFCGFCVKRKWLSENFARDLEAPTNDDMPTLPMDRDEIRTLLEACDRIDNPNKTHIARARLRAKALILTLCYSGLRISDVVSLERARLLADGRLRLRQIKTHGWLTVHLHPDAIAALRALPGDSVYFFWSGPAESKLSTAVGTARRTISCLKRMTSINVHPHRFRDTFAVELLERHGEDIRTVQQLLGHKSLRTTEKHYAHFVRATQDRLSSAVSKLDFSKPGEVIPFPAAKTAG